MNNRIAYLEIDDIQIGQSTKTLEQFPEYDSLNISFDIPYMGNSLVPLDAKFTVDNIKLDKAKYIATNTSIFLNRKRKIKFWAGYLNSGRTVETESGVHYWADERKLFDGNIDKAWFSGVPDTTLFINAWTSLYSMGKGAVGKDGKNGVKFINAKNIDILEDAVKQCKMTLNMTSKIREHPQLQKVIPSFSFTGSTYEYLTRVIKNITGFNLLQNQLLISVENNVVYVRYSQSKNTESPISVGYWNGMVGRVEPNQFGVNIRMMLNPNFYVGQTIELKSRLDSLYNGLYNVYGTVFHGDLRGEEFYTDLICQRVGK